MVWSGVAHSVNGSKYG